MIHNFPQSDVIVPSASHLPQQWGRRATRTAASPGSGFAWWSENAGRLSKTVKT